jgi:tetratricopeptide (TPR) repeat protein
LVLAEFLARQGRLDQALDLCEGAWESVPAELVAQTCVTALYASARSKQQCQRVAGWIERALTKVPGQTTALTALLGTVRMLQGEHSEAERLFRQALARDSQNVPAANNLASHLVLRDGSRAADEALKLINRAIEAAGPLHQLLDTRAMVYLAYGQHVLAVRDLEDALVQSPQAEYYLHLTQAHLRAKDKAKARSAWDKAQERKLKPDTLHPLEQPVYRALVAELAKDS